MLTQIRANAAGVDRLVSALGTGDALKAKLDAELTSQGLLASTGVSQVSTSASGSSSAVNAPKQGNASSVSAILEEVEGSVPLGLILGGAAAAVSSRESRHRVTLKCDLGRGIVGLRSYVK